MLMDALFSACKLDGIHAMTLEVRVSNEKAQNLYKKYGLQPLYYGGTK